jgi:tetratricopeptide (TPR) repeat protein
MQVLHEDKDRKIIPRWRSFHRELITGELKPLKQLEEPIKLPKEFLDEKIESWRENKTLTHATDLVSSALVLGHESEVIDAAKFILSKPQKGNEISHIIAKRALGIEVENDDINISPEILDIKQDRKKIHELKMRLQEEPRNVFILNDIALLYESLGFQEQSERAINMALQIVPDCRFILRSAARLHIHHENGRMAHRLLWSNKRTLYDPWLLSAEIAVASAIGKTSRFVKDARLMIESNDFQPFHISELASAIATLEFEAGKVKRARKYFEQSLVIPTENAVAQASWALRMDANLGIQVNSQAKAPISHEALAWEYNRNTKWDEAVSEAYKWLMDQPFSSRPAILGSYVLALAKQDYEKSMEMAYSGLIANPNDFTLINNYAFAAVKADHLDEAKREFSRIDQTSLSMKDKIVWLATSGLIKYRERLPEEGHQLYMQSIELAKNEPKLACMALFNFTLEEIRINSSESEEYRKKTIESISLSPFADLKFLIKRLEKQKSSVST